MRKVLTDEIRNERCNAAALGLYNASVSNDKTNVITDEELTLVRASNLAERSYQEVFRLQDPKQAFEKLDKQYVERKKALNDYNAKDDEYTIATEILYKRLGRKLPKNK